MKGGLSSLFFHVQLLRGSVAVTMAWPGRWGRGWHEASMEIWRISPRATWLLTPAVMQLQETCVDHWWQSCLLSPCRGSGMSPWPFAGPAWPVALEEPLADAGGY